jgi:hypothetical protein
MTKRTWRETTPHRVGSKTESSDEISFQAAGSNFAAGHNC